MAEATSAAAVDDIARVALANHALHYLDCELPQPLNEALASELLRGLAQAITVDAPVQLSRPYAIQDTASPLALHSELVGLTALDPENSAPFWDRPWCPPELFDLLFSGSRRTYLILDASKYARIEGEFDFDMLADTHKIESLYTGDAARDLHDVAPYLIDVTLSTSDPSALHRDFFKKHWGKGSGLFVRSDLSFEALRKHLRGFTRIRSSGTAKGWTTFRFWDPLVARIYFLGLDHNPDRVARFFQTPSTALNFVIEHGPDAALHLWPTDLSQNFQAGGRPPLVFDATDFALMDQVVLAGLGQELVDWLAAEHPDRFADFTPNQFGHLAHHILIQGQHCGCETKDDFAFLAQMMLTLGGWFHRSATPAPLVQIIRETGAHQTVLSKNFLSAFADTAQSELVSQFSDVHAYLTALPERESVSPSQFRAFCARFLGDRPVATEDALKATKYRLADLKLNETQTGRLLVLTLILGHRFYEDPFRPWAHPDKPDAVGEALAAAWKHLGLP
ncbi:DUF4123 domain-containing protein [Litoreibacter meonggei]|uniref:DUF4123 domain-containing protein n=1 Tax=Litoreibacter meonggei TaxID=1049199 RepID=UPI001472B591|nr:DUF4123 domain-containing protein [Litoreibacter meonggei]